MENQFRFYNTLTRKIETVIPHEDGKIKMYTCGPTVYHFAHIGNLRTYIMEDILVRGLSYVGYDVKRVMNITDVGHLSSDADTGEDKMLKGAKREHKTVMEVAKFYADAFFEDCRKLNIKKADVVEPATHCIPEFIHMIEVLLKKGYAYQAGGNVYFDTSRLEDYFVFSSAVEKEQLQVGVRDDVEEDENKRNKNDFVLWFTKSKFEDQALKWDSPWGVGYPGWHIECSCIGIKHLGEYMDIHCGGEDNIFPQNVSEEEIRDFEQGTVKQTNIYCYAISGLGDLCIYVVPGNGVLQAANRWEVILVIMLVICILVCVVVVLIYIRHILFPLQSFVNSLDELDTDTYLHDNSSNNLLELESANEQFRNLVRKIQALKITIYEKELNEKQIELEFAQEQIRPHFFLNCISLIHGIADNKGETDIVTITSILSDYIRYIY